jgi:iron complex outermembrane receptor protein
MHRRGDNVILFSSTSSTAKLRLSFAAACLAGTALVAPARAQDAGQLPPVNVEASRIGTGIVGASTSVITAEDIAHAPGQTVQDVLATIPGVQVQTLYGGVNGVGSAVDLRGFGAFATANTLVLVNGRRLNDIDLAGVDLSTIPLQSIERIEVTRGNSGAVLYGDNAVGGVINIVTKTGANGKPITMRAEAGVGSFNQQSGNVSATVNSGPWSAAVFGNAVKSDGYRINNALEQKNGMGEVRYSTPGFSAFLNLSADDQRLGFPGGRFVDPSATPPLNELVTDRRGTSTPRDYGDKQGVNLTAGFTKSLWDGAELIVDGGVRNKKQQAGFFTLYNESYVDTTLTAWSITPRLRITNAMFGLPSTILTGIDYYDSTYDSNRSMFKETAPIHVYNLKQQTLAGYWQQTLAVLPTTDFSYGGRIQHMSLDARDTYDPSAYGASGAQSTPLNTSETNHALHVGLEHRFNENVAVFARAARAFRTPNVDERLITGSAWDCSAWPSPCIPIAQNFMLKTQTSYDVEGGIRIHGNGLDIQSSVYDMHLKNEIHYDPVNMFNYNLDPTHRYGTETSVALRISDTLRLRGGFAYTRAVFEEGPFSGKDVPLVSRLSGSAGLSWNVWQKYVVVDATARLWSSRRMDNDQSNTQPTIPANATMDLKVSGEIDRFFWSASVNNLFNAQYYDYAIASAFTAGRFSAYPLPGRVYMVKAGVTF